MTRSIPYQAFLLLVPLAYFLVAALLAPFMAYSLHAFTGELIPFHKLVSRSAQLLLIAGIYPAFTLINLHRSDFGFAGFANAFFNRIAVGFGTGVLILGPLALLLLTLNIRVIDWEQFASVGLFSTILGKSIIIGIIVAVIEEPLFRGLLLGGLMTRSRAGFALSTSAFYYALLHFLHSDITFDDGQVNWLSGFQVIFDAFGQIANTEIFDSFFALFLAGVFLGLVRLRYKNGLAVCIGLHAGWVFIIKFTKALTDRNSDTAWSNLVGTYDGVIGYLAAGWLAVLIAGFLLFLRAPTASDKKSAAEQGEVS